MSLQTASRSAQDFMLYWISGSAPCWRIMIAMEEKGLSGYSNKMIDFDKKEHKSAEVLAINPRGQVPTFKHGDAILNESMAAVLYLEDLYKTQGTQLIPEDPALKAMVYMRAMEAYNLHEIGIEAIDHYIRWTKPEKIDWEMVRQRKDRLARELKTWDGYLEKSGGPHVCGKEFSLADVSFYPMITFFLQRGIRDGLQQNCPNLVSYWEKLKERPSIDKTWPPTWKTTPPEDLMKDIFQ